MSLIGLHGALAGMAFPGGGRDAARGRRGWNGAQSWRSSPPFARPDHERILSRGAPFTREHRRPAPLAWDGNSRPHRRGRAVMKRGRRLLRHRPPRCRRFPARGASGGARGSAGLAGCEQDPHGDIRRRPGRPLPQRDRHRGRRPGVQTRAARRARLPLRRGLGLFLPSPGGRNLRRSPPRQGHPHPVLPSCQWHPRARPRQLCGRLIRSESSGETGDAQGKHLHFTVYDEEAGSTINPLSFLPPRADRQPPVIRRILLVVGDQSWPLSPGLVMKPGRARSSPRSTICGRT